MERFLFGLLGVALIIVGVAWAILRRLANRFFPPPTIIVVERQGHPPGSFAQSWVRILLGLIAIGAVMGIFHPR